MTETKTLNAAIPEGHDTYACRMLLTRRGIAKPLISLPSNTLPVSWFPILKEMARPGDVVLMKGRDGVQTFGRYLMTGANTRVAFAFYEAGDGPVVGFANENMIPTKMREMVLGPKEEIALK